MSQKIKTTIATLLFSVALSCCNTNDNNYNEILYPYPVIDEYTREIDSYRLIFPPETSEKKMELLESSAKTQIDRFHLDWTSDYSPCDIVYFDQDYLFNKSNNNNECLGLHFYPPGVIHIVFGERLSSSALYHELVHQNIRFDETYMSGNPVWISDINHSDPRWESFWNPRWLQVLNEIISDRANMDLED